jgi:hypothetical protein
METLAVPAGPCPCPGTPHAEGDTVHLRQKLGLAAGIMLQRLIVEANQNRADSAELTGQLAEAYLRVGVASWTFVGDHERPIPVTPDTIQALLLDDFERGAPVADAADQLYMVPVLGPLVKRVANSSPSTMTNGSTSPMAGGSSKGRKRSKRSSTSTTQTDATEATTA